jgi:hypothetical protein
MASFFYAQLSPTERPDVDQDTSKRQSRKKYGDGLITQVSVDVRSQSIDNNVNLLILFCL